MLISLPKLQPNFPPKSGLISSTKTFPRSRCPGLGEKLGFTPPKTNSSPPEKFPSREERSLPTTFFWRAMLNFGGKELGETFDRFVFSQHFLVNTMSPTARNLRLCLKKSLFVESIYFSGPILAGPTRWAPSGYNGVNQCLRNGRKQMGNWGYIPILIRVITPWWPGAPCTQTVVFSSYA